MPVNAATGNRCAAIGSSERTGRHDSDWVLPAQSADMDLGFVADQIQALNGGRGMPLYAARRHHQRMARGAHSIGKNWWIQPPLFLLPYRTHYESRPRRTG
ncbi:hypothetical protein GCM10008098_01350 [Rhodanobacter panaciterrae]|uniref:Uncharacterized protein n=1 Tax=Rhodanobacter panaciterrae TaxID=490572 RepID=A0ABQ2ZEH6_9GAMM|nr:hypothetical protein GCM10008098_01350 [Rhodanobacter panaciterrae]